MTGWREQALAARTALGDAKVGQREEILARIGAGTNANTVRRRISALDFLDTLAPGEPALAKALEAASWVHVELLARWARAERPAAMAAAPSVAAGKYTIAALRRELEVLKSKARVPTKAESLARIEPAVRAAVSAAFGDVAAMMDSDCFKELGPPVHLSYNEISAIAGFHNSIGVLVVGPYGNRSLYKKHRSGWTARLMSAAWFYDKAVLAVPEGGDIGAYRDCVEEALEAIRSRAERPSAVQFVAPNVVVMPIAL